MNNFKYDYYVAGRWRNHAAIQTVVDAIRKTGKTAYCFIDNEYDSDGIKQAKNPLPTETVQSNVEHLTDWQTNPTFRKMFDNDMNGLKEAETFVLVLPAGLSAHMELGVAYGLGKKCYGVGTPDKVESLYLMFDEIFPDVEKLVEKIA